MGFFDSDVEAGSAYNLPTDYKSGLADILAEAKKLYEARKQTGYQTFEGLFGNIKTWAKSHKRQFK